MRVYLVVLDESEEAHVALRFASHRAIKTGGNVHILALVPKQDFVAWGGVQDTIEEEARDRAEALLSSAAGTMAEESGQRPAISVRVGDAVKVVRQFLSEHPDIAALVLATAPSGQPGPLVSHFSTHDVGSLPCPLMLIPGGLSKEEIDRLS